MPNRWMWHGWMRTMWMRTRRMRSSGTPVRPRRRRGRAWRTSARARLMLTALRALPVLALPVLALPVVALLFVELPLTALPGVELPVTTLPVSGAVADPAAAPAQVTATVAPARWSWPTPSRVVIRPWEAPATDYGPGHRGLDVPAGSGTPAAAPADGTVAFAGHVGGRPVVTIDHGGGLVSTLDPVEPSVPSGTPVRRGDPVGTVGSGHCPVAQPCLHLGARVNGRYVDPLPLLPRPAWPVLLPESQARG